MTTCNQTAHWNALDLECSLPKGHLLWHYDEATQSYYDKYQENRTEDMEAVEKYCDARIQETLVQLAKKGLV